MADKKLSKKLHEKLKDIYPESRSLDVDREYTAETVLDPNKPEDIKKWSQKPNRIDLKGFDDRASAEPSIKKVTSEITTGDTGEDVLINEPERFLNTGTVTRELLEKGRDKMVDFPSFVEQVKKNYSDDRNLRSLIQTIGNRTEGYLSLFNQPEIQDWIKQNTMPQLVNYLTKTYGVEPVRASRILNKLGDKTRNKFYSKVKRTKMPRFIMPRISRPKVSRKRWSEQEMNILRENQNLGFNAMYKIFTASRVTKRSKSSVKNQFYKIKRGEVK